MNKTERLIVDNVQIVGVSACTEDDVEREPALPNTGCSGIGMDVHEVGWAVIKRVRVRQLKGKSISFVNSPFTKVTAGPCISFSMAHAGDGKGWYLNRFV